MMYILGYVCGFILGWSVFSNTTSEDALLKEAQQLTKQCEQGIPRNQHCQLKAVPVEVGNTQ